MFLEAVKLDKSFILTIFVFFLIYYLFFSQSENFDNNETNPQKNNLANNIINFMKNDTTYKEYLDFLKSDPNLLSYKILEQETFFEILFRKRNNNLTLSSVLNLITDM